MFNAGPLELFLLFAIVLIVLGPDKLPQVARALSQTLNQWRDITAQVRGSLQEPPTTRSLEPDLDIKPKNPSASATNKKSP